MPLKDVTLTYFQMKTMGLYAHSGKKGETPKQYLMPKGLMKELKEWAHGPIRKFIETATFSSNSQSLESYCLDFYEEGGEYIVALWNRVPNSKNGFASVSAKSSALETVVQHTKIGEDDIPGFPTFFFVSPKNKCIATIKLDNHVMGITQFKNYIKGYLRCFSSHMVDRYEGEQRIQGNCAVPKPLEGEDNRFPDKGIYHSFIMPPLTDVISEEYLLNNSHNITKIVKDITTENLLVDTNESSVERFLRFMKGIPISKKKTTRISVPATLTRTHVKTLIREYHTNDCSNEFNVGFVFKGDSQKIHWLSGTPITNTIQGNLKMLSADRPELKSLMAVIKQLDHAQIAVKDFENVA